MFTSKQGIEVADIPTLTKQYIREKVWDYIEDNDLADFPRPVHNRIPNFKGASAAGQRVSELECFRAAQTVKVNPDKPQEEVRFYTLEAGKTLLVPTPRLRSGLFNLLQCLGAEGKESLRIKAQTEGMKKHSAPVGLDMTTKVDLIVLGSVAVSVTGRRIGKGEGFADMEYAMMRSVGAVDDSTPVVTTVHDCQVFDDLPRQLFGPHDLPVDFIVTPTEVIQVTHSLPKPMGIYWDMLTPEKFRQVPILRVLYEREAEEGRDVTLAGGVDLPPPEELRGGGRARGRGGGRGRGGAGRGRGGAGRGGAGRPRYGSEGEETKGQKNIQVTINVSKKNRIVRRTVEATHEHDRLGSADLDDEGSSSGGGGGGGGGRMMPRGSTKKPRVPISFAVFLGKVPPACRVRELKDALQTREVRPVDITWRGRNGFAFLRFTGPVEECEDVLGKLAGLTLQEQPIVVERAKDRKGEEPDDDAREAYFYDEGGDPGEDSHRYGYAPASRKPPAGPKKSRLPITYAVFLGKVPPTCRVRELKEALQSRKVQPADITWRGRSGFAFLRFTGPAEECEDILSSLEGLSLQDQPIVVERAKDKGEDVEEGGRREDLLELRNGGDLASDLG